MHGLGQPAGAVGMQLGTLSLSPYGALCARTVFPRRAEVEGKEECMCVCVWDKCMCVCVCVCVWLLPHQKCQHCYTCLFMGSLLSPVVAQGDHLQSHLHNDNNRVTWSGCECVSALVFVRTHVFMCT